MATSASLTAHRPCLTRPASLSLSGVKGSGRHPKPHRQRVVAARASQDKGNVESFRSGVEAMMNKYDFLSTGVGALSVTSYFVVFGHQDASVALQITASSVVIGLVLNELLFCDT